MASFWKDEIGGSCPEQERNKPIGISLSVCISPPLHQLWHLSAVCLSVCAELSLIQWKCLDACSSGRAARHWMVCQAPDRTRPVGTQGRSPALWHASLTHQRAVEHSNTRTTEEVFHSWKDITNIFEIRSWLWYSETRMHCSAPKSASSAGRWRTTVGWWLVLANCFWIGKRYDGRRSPITWRRNMFSTVWCWSHLSSTVEQRATKVWVRGRLGGLSLDFTLGDGVRVPRVNRDLLLTYVIEIS